MFRPGLFLVLSAALSACGGPSAPDEPAQQDAESQESIPAAPESDAVRPGADLDLFFSARGDDGPFLQSLQPPRTVRAEAVENRHVEGQIDTVRTYVYDGLQVEAYEVTGGRTFIRRVEVTSDAYETSQGLTVGDLRSDVEAVLGPPVEDEGATVIYETGDELTPTTVEVHYERGEDGPQRAVSIVWSLYVD